MEYIDEEAYFDCTNGGYIGGHATYTLTIENDYSSDVGGRDGPCITGATLEEINLDGFIVTREQIIGFAGLAQVQAAEDAICTVAGENGDFPVAA